MDIALACIVVDGVLAMLIRQVCNFPGRNKVSNPLVFLFTQPRKVGLVLFRKC